VALILPALLLFQNCELNNSSGSGEKTSPSEGQFGGNGEGYTGKPDGLYATLDTTGVCGTVNTSSYKVKDQIEVKSGKLQFISKNCAPLPAPQAIDNPSLTAVESKGGMFVLDTQMFQRGDFIGGGQATPSQFADFYCRGWDPVAPAAGQKRLVELTMYQGTEAIISDPLGIYGQDLRKGLMRLIDIFAGDNRLAADNAYNLDPLYQGTLPGLGFFITPVFPGPTDFWFEYYDPNGIAPFAPSMTYNVNGGPERLADPMTCWSTY